MKNNKNYDFAGLFDGNVSKLLIGLLGVSVLALVLYFGVSLTSKGTFSAGESDQYGQSIAESSFVENQVYCYIYPQTSTHTIKEKVFLTDCDGKDANNNTICHGRLHEENINMEYDSSIKVNGVDTSVVNNNIFPLANIYPANHWACEKDFDSYGRYMCDKDYGFITYIAGCRKYDENATDANHQVANNNDSDTMCGIMGYYLYKRSQLDELETCMVTGAAVAHANPNEQHIVGVNMCDLQSKNIVSIVSQKDGVYFEGPLTPRGSYEVGGEYLPSGYLAENLADGDSPVCNFKKCYKCNLNSTGVLATSEKPETRSVHADQSCPEGYVEEEITTCVKNCLYCSDGQIKTYSNIYAGLQCSGVYGGTYEDTSEVRESLDCSSTDPGTTPGTDPGTTPGTDPGTTPTDTESVKCYRCSPTPEEREFTDTTTCPTDGGWIEGNLNCPGSGNGSGNSGTDPGNSTLKDCYQCRDGEVSTYKDSSCPQGWSETRPNCSNEPGDTTQTTCYYCSGGNRQSFTLEDSANGDCSKSSLHSGAVADSGLVCYSETKKCYNDPNKSVGEWVKVVSCDSGDTGYCTLTDGRKVNKSTITDSSGCNVDDNSQTGSTAIIIAWIIGITAIGYAFYYFRQTNVKEN